MTELLFLKSCVGESEKPASTPISCRCAISAVSAPRERSASMRASSPAIGRNPARSIAAVSIQLPYSVPICCVTLPGAAAARSARSSIARTSARVWSISASV